MSNFHEGLDKFPISNLKSTVFGCPVQKCFDVLRGLNFKCCLSTKNNETEDRAVRSEKRKQTMKRAPGLAPEGSTKLCFFMHAAYHTSVMPKYKNNRNPFTQISKYKHFVLELFFLLHILPHQPPPNPRP